MPHTMQRFTLERTVPMPRGEVWELLADTDRFNRVIQLPSVDFTLPAADDTTLVREARAKFRKIIPLRWREFPFEWVKQERYAVLREYQQGPLSRVFGGIELSDDGPRATRILVFSELTPANALGELLMGFVARDMLRRTVEYCEKAVALRRLGQARARPRDPFRSPINASLLAALLDRLRSAPVRADLVEPLGEFLREGSDDEVAGLKPKCLARDWGVDSDDVLRLCLHATKIGLLNLSWHEMCPNCRVSKADVASLGDLQREVHCDMCGVDFEVNFDRYVELRFAVHPALRAATAGVYCIGGPLLTPHILAQTPIANGGTASLPIPNLDEPLRLRVLKLNHIANLTTDTAPSPIALHEDGWESGCVGAAPGQSLQLRNDCGRDVVVALEKQRWDEDAVTAAEVTTLQEFRDMFSSEVLAPGQTVGVENLTLFFSDLCDSTQLYETIGDAPAYGRVRRHFTWMFAIIAAHHGAVVKTVGDAVMAAFLSPEEALRAALEIQERVGEFNATLPEGVSIKIGLHHGPAIAINQNGLLDYFGRTVNLAARVQGVSAGGEVIASEEIAGRETVRDLLKQTTASTEPFTIILKGIEGEQKLLRVRVV